MAERAIRRSRLGASRSGNKKQTRMYKIWRSKQNSGFCGTRVQVGLYLGTPWPDKRCSNCCRRETAAHHLLCSNEDRTQLLINNTDKLGQWLEKGGITDQELAYWIPKYILMQGDKPFADLGAMSPRMKALAQSQDMIGCRNFIEGHISTHFYEIQNFHLAMSSSFLNTTDWAKQFISKILHVSHSQWIFCNISFIPPQEEGRRDSPQARVAGRNSPGRCPSQKLIFT